MSPPLPRAKKRPPVLHLMKVGSLFLAGFLFLPEVAVAGRALVLNGFGPEQLAMGGADIALSRDSHAVNTNPAGLTQIDKRAAGGYVYGFAANFKYYDSLGNDEHVDDPFGVITGLSMAQRLERFPDIVASGGLYVQGGSGIGHDDLVTRFGTRDEISFNVGLTKLVAGLGWQATEQLRVGASLGVGYTQGRQKLLPDTSSASDPNDAFFGVRFDGGTGTSANGIFGFQYEFNPEWTLAATYTSKSRLKLEDGTATFNFEALGLGRVKYQDASISGLAFPQELDIGLAWRPKTGLVIVAEFNWLDSSRALSSTRFLATGPSNSSAPAEIDVVQQLRWRDHYVYAFGFAWDQNARRTWRSGFVVSNNPIRSETATPAINLGQRLAIMGGYQTRLKNGWAYDVSMEYQAKTNQRYTNPSLGLGENSRNAYEAVLFVVSLSRRW